MSKLISLEPKEVIIDWVAERVGGHPGYKATAIGLMDTAANELCAGVFYQDHSGPNIVMSVAGKGDRWMTREFLWFVFWYPFVQLDCERITGLIDETNVASQRLVKHLGFREEARLKRASRGGYDLIIYVLWRDECRWHRLKEKRHGQGKRTRSTELCGGGSSTGGCERPSGAVYLSDQPPQRIHA